VGVPTRHIGLFAAQGNRLYCVGGPTSSDVFYSGHGGQKSKFKSHMVATIFCLATFGRYLFAGTSGSGIYRSEDNGASWERVSDGLPSSYAGVKVSAIVVTDSQPFVATPKGVYSSTNFGETWSPTALTNAQVYSFTADGSNVFAGTCGEGMLYGSDDGRSWSTLGHGLEVSCIKSCCASKSWVLAIDSDGRLFRYPLSGGSDASLEWGKYASSPAHKFLQQAEPLTEFQAAVLLWQDIFPLITL